MTATDELGVSASKTVTINVVNPPSISPPFVTITSPEEGAYLDPYKAVTLNAAISNPDDGNAVPISYLWTVTVNGVDRVIGVDKVIGDTLTLLWVPSSDVTFDCGGQFITLTLKATDDDGPGKESGFRSVPAKLPPSLAQGERQERLTDPMPPELEADGTRGRSPPSSGSIVPLAIAVSGPRERAPPTTS